VLVDVADDRLRSRAETLRADTGAEVEGLVGDVGDEETLRAAVARAEEAFGGLDVLVNNACAARHRPVTELSAEEWRETIDACLASVFYGTKHALPVMTKEDGGAIINVSSVNSRVATPGMPAYTAAKGGVVGLTRQVAVEYGPDGIRCNAIRPGFIATEALKEGVLAEPDERTAAVDSCPLRRIGTPDDVAGVALFLASEAAAYVNGEVLTVDGGTSVQWPPTLVRPGLREKAGLDPL
jgi:NAD(P)-dependent dehydrogenase (short-subunit alcohol dehydrogenase family)